MKQNQSKLLGELMLGDMNEGLHKFLISEWKLDMLRKRRDVN